MPPNSLSSSRGLSYEKIQPYHLERLAVVYVRQSSMQQVVQHQESTRLQYGLVDRALALGWPRERILIIDDDLGKSGTSSQKRQGFQQLVAEVSLDHVGLILGLEMSRLARSCKDWHQLLEICALFKTLISDLDGIYEPSHYNDRLLLGLKGTMSEAELHILKQRLHQGKLNKARRGELHLRLPTGYVYGPSGDIVKDPDAEVQQVIGLIFKKFEEYGTVGSVLKYLVEHDICLGMRRYDSAAKGQLEWRSPNRPTLQGILKHPAYAGVYAYGRRQIDAKKQRTGRPHTGRNLVSMEDWHVCLREQFPAYISWEQFVHNQAELQANRSISFAPGAIRHGPTLLPGLLVCGKCGARLAVVYQTASYFGYHCVFRRQHTYGPKCQHLSGPPLDAFITQQVLDALRPAALEVSLQAADHLEQDRGELHQLWQSRLERAAFEAERAGRHYRLTEPENRLVARQLAQDWEAKLLAQQELQEEYERFLQQQPRTLSPQERQAIRQLAADIPTLWQEATTTQAQRQAIIRQLIDHITVNVEGESERTQITIHWVGGCQTQSVFIRPVSKFTQLSYYAELCQRIRELKTQGLPHAAIARQINQEGFRPSKRARTFNAASIASLVRSLGLSQPQPTKYPDEVLQPNEWWLTNLANVLEMPPVTLLRWRTCGLLKARQFKEASPYPWIIWADETEIQRLRNYRQRDIRKEGRERWLKRKMQFQEVNPNSSE
ncbi:MAG: recombinase family protein [Cyanobacteria bacterium P01_H01_bin.58]